MEDRDLDRGSGEGMSSSADAYTEPLRRNTRGTGATTWRRGERPPRGQSLIPLDTFRPPKLPSPTFVKDRALDMPPDYFSAPYSAERNAQAGAQAGHSTLTMPGTEGRQAQEHAGHAGSPAQEAIPVRLDDAQDQDGSGGPQSHLEPLATAVGPGARRIHYPEDFDDHAARSGQAGLHLDNFESSRPDFSRTSTGNSETEGAAFSLPGSAHTSDEEENDIDRDVYDWSDEEDLITTEARTEKEAALQQDSFQYRKRRIVSPWRLIVFLFTTLIGAVIGVILLIIPPVIINYIYEGDNPNDHVLFIAMNVKAWFFFAAFNWTMAWVAHFAVETLPRLITRVTKIILGVIPEKLTSVLEFYHASKLWLKLLCVASSIWGSWTVIFAGIYQLYSFDGNSRQEYTNVIYQLLELLFFAALLLWIEKTLMQVIAIRFHRTAYADRIKDASLALSVLDKLKFYRPPASQRRPRSRFFNLSTPNMTGAKASPLGGTSRPSSAAGYFGMVTGQAGRRSPRDEEKKKAVKETLIGHPVRPSHGRTRSGNITLTAAKVGQVFKSAAILDPLAYFTQRSALDATSPHAAKKLARNLYYTLRQDQHRDYLVRADFEPIFPKAEESKEAFDIFDRDGNGDISRSELKTSVLRIYKERRLLSRGLQDVGSAVAKLDRIFIVAGIVILFFIALQIFHVDISKSLTTFYTLGIGASFIFKNLAQQVFDSIIFVFVTHTFDTGDKVIIVDSTTGLEDIVSVKKMGLLSTVFVRVDGSEMYVANSVLNQMLITNLRRSSNQGENATIQIDWATPEWKIDELEKRMNDWLQNDTRAYEPSTAATYQHVDYTNSLTITFWMCLKGTWQDWGGRWKHRTAFHAALAHFIKELGITYAHYPQRIAYWSDQPMFVGSQISRESRSEASGRSTNSPPPPPFRQRVDSSPSRARPSQDAAPGTREDSNLTLHEMDSGHSSHETAVSNTSLGPISEQQGATLEETAMGRTGGLDRNRSILGFRAPAHGRGSVRRPREGSTVRQRVGYDRTNYSMGDGGS